MAPRKTKDETAENEELAESGSTTANIAAREATRAANANIEIDFGTSLAPETFAKEKSERVSVWTQKLAAIRDATDNGDAQVGVLYRIGTFTSKNGARSTLRSLANDESKVPAMEESYEFSLDTRIVGEGSELWAGVVQVTED